MYQILFIFALFSFNDTSWGTRATASSNSETLKDPIISFFEPWLEQPFINWIFYEYLNSFKKKHDPPPIRQEQPTRKDSISIEISNLLNIHKDNIINPDQISEENIDHVKSLVEQTWSTYQQTHKEQIKKKKIHYQIEVIAPGSIEQQTLLNDLTKIKKKCIMGSISSEYGILYNDCNIFNF